MPNGTPVRAISAMAEPVKDTSTLPALISVV